jgi:hypothetical protein
LTQLRPLAQESHGAPQPSSPHALPAQLGTHLALARNLLHLALFLIFLQFLAAVSSAQVPQIPSVPTTCAMSA